MASTVGVVLAAGQSKRMNSGLLKILHPVGGRPMVGHVVDAIRAAGIDDVVVVVGNQAELVRDYLGDNVRYVVQEQQLGTGHAALQAEKLLPDFKGDVLVVSGDVPLVDPAVLSRLVFIHSQRDATATLLTARLHDPTGYGRIIRTREGRLVKVVEEKDATPEEAAVREVNTSIGVYRNPPFFQALRRVGNDNAQGEHYLTDLPEVLRQMGYEVEAVLGRDARAALGVNTRQELARVERVLRLRTLDRLMSSGVTIVDPATTYVDSTVDIGQDTVIHPFTMIKGETRIGERCELGPQAHIEECVVGHGCRVLYSVIEKSRLESEVTVGPFSHLRTGSVLEQGVRMGNFAEIKNSTVGAGTKVSHHSYIGDADIGAGTNIGAGTVFVNYDGEKKHRTTVGEDVFIGCNTNLVAPVRLGRGAYTAAGSTITEDVPEGALGIARERQTNIEGWVEGRKSRKKE